MRSLGKRDRLEIGLAALLAVFVITGLLLVLRGGPRAVGPRAVGGFFLGAALVGALNLVDAKRRQRVDAKDRHETGLDETRRLLYAAHMAAGRDADHDAWQLGGTVANAVAHHWPGQSQSVALELGRKITWGAASQEELLELINEVTAELANEGSSNRRGKR